MPAPEFRFVHAADLHLDTPFAMIGRVAPEIAQRLRDASLVAFDALVRMAIEREAAFVIFAGDVYDSADRSVRAQLRFLRGVEKLGERQIPVFMAHGNHDPLDGWPAAPRLPRNLIVFGSEAVETHTIRIAGEARAQVYGISYGRRDVTENLALRFRRRDQPGVHIGVLHCNAGSQPEYAAYSPCTVADLSAAGMDYWALGHIHQHQRLLEGRPWIVYPGSLQAGKSSEIGPRGAVVVEVSGNGVAGVEFVALDCVRFARVDVDISSEPDLHSLRKAILGLAVGDGMDVVLTVVLSGRGALHGELRRHGAIDDLLRDLREELGVASPFVWIDRIIDQSRAELDRETIARRGDFSAELTRLVDGLRDEPETLRSLLAGILRPGDRFAQDDAESLLREAEDRALDLLEGERQR
jgi:DNA repair exonuclease SbcCD nuclease subunit